MLGQAIPQCPKSSSHCLHATNELRSTAVGGWYPVPMVCCHCGQKFDDWQGGQTMFHGPFAPGNQWQARSP